MPLVRCYFPALVGLFVATTVTFLIPSIYKPITGATPLPTKQHQPQQTLKPLPICPHTASLAPPIPGSGGTGPLAHQNMLHTLPLRPAHTQLQPTAPLCGKILYALHYSLRFTRAPRESIIPSSEHPRDCPHPPPSCGPQCR